MRNRHGQMDQDLYIHDLKDALEKAIILIKRQAKSGHNPKLVTDVDDFLYNIGRE